MSYLSRLFIFCCLLSAIFFHIFTVVSYNIDGLEITTEGEIVQKNGFEGSLFFDLTVKELKKIIQLRGRKCIGCIEKSDFVSLANELKEMDIIQQTNTVDADNTMKINTKRAKRQQKEDKEHTKSREKNSKTKIKNKYKGFNTKDKTKLPYYNIEENYTEYPPCADPKSFYCNMQFVQMKYQQVCCGRMPGPPQPTGTGPDSMASRFRSQTVHRDGLGRVVGVERG